MNLFNKLICRFSNDSTSSTHASRHTNQPSTQSIIIGPDHLKALLYSGYFRTNYNSNIPSGIINLCTSFSDYLCYHWIMQPPQFITPPGKVARYAEVRSPIISTNGINFQILIKTYKGGQQDRNGELSVTLKPEKTVLSDEISSTTLRFNYYLIVNGISDSFKQGKSHWITWDYSYCQSRTTVELWCKTQREDIHSMKLVIYPEIFDIRYKDKNKRFDKQAKLYRKVKYKWDIDDEKLELFKTTQSTFNSPCFGNWVLSFTPYGSDDRSSLGLRLHSIPSALGSLTARVTFKYEYGNQRSKRFRSHVKEHLFIFPDPYYKREAYWDKAASLSSEFFEMESLCFMVDIEIIKVYPWKKNSSLPIYQWTSYNIMNRTYTNFEVTNNRKHEERAKIDGQKDTPIYVGNHLFQILLRKWNALETMQADFYEMKEKLAKLEDNYHQMMMRSCVKNDPLWGKLECRE